MTALFSALAGIFDYSDCVTGNGGGSAPGVLYICDQCAGAPRLAYLCVHKQRSVPQEVVVAMAKPASFGGTFPNGFIPALLRPQNATIFAAFLPQCLRREVVRIFQGSATASMPWRAEVSLKDPRAPFVSLLGRIWGGGTLVGLGILAVDRHSE